MVAEIHRWKLYKKWSWRSLGRFAIKNYLFIQALKFLSALKILYYINLGNIPRKNFDKCTKLKIFGRGLSYHSPTSFTSALVLYLEETRLIVAETRYKLKTYHPAPSQIRRRKTLATDRDSLIVFKYKAEDNFDWYTDTAQLFPLQTQEVLQERNKCSIGIMGEGWEKGKRERYYKAGSGVGEKITSGELLGTFWLDYCKTVPPRECV